MIRQLSIPTNTTTSSQAPNPITNINLQFINNVNMINQVNIIPQNNNNPNHYQP
jgi:hypothetical protein